MKKALEVGNSAPDFSIINQNGKTIGLNDLSGKWSVIYFYPRDDTPGCTVEAKEFTDLNTLFEKQGCRIVGVSPDNEKSHLKFISKFNLGFNLIADIDKKMCLDYGVFSLKKFMGREYMGINRITYILDENHMVSDVIEKVKTKTRTGP